MPGVCGVLKSSCVAEMTLTPLSRQLFCDAALISFSFSCKVVVCREVIPLTNNVAVEVTAELKAEAGFRRHHQFAVHGHRHFFEQPERPRHILHRETVGNGRHEVHVDLRQEVAYHWKVESLCHAGDLDPVGDTAD